MNRNLPHSRSSRERLLTLRASRLCLAMVEPEARHTVVDPLLASFVVVLATADRRGAMLSEQWPGRRRSR